jgi:hypothetical protein
VITFIYLGVLVLTGGAMYMWARSLVKKFEKDPGTTPPHQGNKAKRATSGGVETKSTGAAGDEQSNAAGGSAHATNCGEAA